MSSKRSLRVLQLFLALLFTALPLFSQDIGVALADKGKPRSQPSAAANTTYVTVGQGTPTAPLQINAGVDLSYQIFYNYNDGNPLSGNGQIFPPNGQLADDGTLLWIGNTVYGPDFENHDDGSAFRGGAIIPFTPVSQT